MIIIIIISSLLLPFLFLLLVLTRKFPNPAFKSEIDRSTHYMLYLLSYNTLFPSILST